MSTLALNSVHKSFGAIQALDGVSCRFMAGSVHALLGENGAGKSTALSLLSGLQQPDRGTIRINDSDEVLDGPADALKQGIATVFQHFTLVPGMTVTENLQLGLSGSRLVSPDDLRVLLAETGIGIPPDVLIERLTVGQRQTVEIAKALLHRPAFLLLDEPTSVLSGPEIERLLEVVRRVAAGGTGVVLVTHKLPEALSIADRITVLRSGQVAGKLELEEIPRAERGRISYQLVDLMFGDRAHVQSRLEPPVPGAMRAVTPLLSEATPVQGNVVTRLTGIRARDNRGFPVLDDLSLVLARGDVLGIAGVDGNGQRELVEVLAGERSIESGSLEIDGTGMTNAGTRALIAAGVGVVTAERIAVGCVPGTSVATNIALKHLADPPFRTDIRLHRKLVRRFAADVIRDYEIRPGNPDLPITHLSGGNIQRVLIGRELAFGPRVLVCHEPTAGLDAATAETMLQHLRDAARTGAGVLLISSDLDELMHTCDRIAVLFRGRIIRVLTRGEFQAGRIGRMMVTGQDPGA